MNYVVKRAGHEVARFEYEQDAHDYCAGKGGTLTVTALCRCGQEMGDGRVEVKNGAGAVTARYCSFTCPLAPAKTVYQPAPTQQWWLNYPVGARTFTYGHTLPNTNRPTLDLRPKITGAAPYSNLASGGQLYSSSGTPIDSE